MTLCVCLLFVYVSYSNYSLLLSVLEYQTAVMRSDFETADKVLPTVPAQYRTRVAHFLEKQVMSIINAVFLSNKVIGIHYHVVEDFSDSEYPAVIFNT